MSVAELIAEHGSPLWLADVDRARERLREFRAAWEDAWPDVHVSYSYKTNRLPAFLRALAAEGAGHEVVCAAEYALAVDVVGADGADVTVNGPAKPDALLARAAQDGALVVVDAQDELDRAAAAGVRRVGLRVAVPGIGVEPTRFGIEPDAVVAAAGRAAALGLRVEALAVHLVSTGFDRPLASAPRLGAAIVVSWPPPPDGHAAAAALLGALAVQLGIGAVDLGGSFPPAPAVAGHARAVAQALHASGFAGRLMVEPGRAIVADAVDLACSVVAVKRMADGTRCVVVDAGTNLVPGALWGWPRIEPARAARSDGPALVSGPLCLNVDVLHPAAELPVLRPGDALVVRDVGAYQQVQSTQFGDLRPAVVAREDGRWRLCTHRETLDDLLAGDLDAAPAAAQGGGRR
ncbi:MAG: diaminopimelate decarboxylase [Solirubrobacteraceae bacterium]|jgi:diaminopimelate decarboxylase|nr:diaminopimelate decarboxylase [Solirubrobacteraceae bacterium]